jgi:LPXTG-motif cell wall-anchored protein
MKQKIQLIISTILTLTMLIGIGYFSIAATTGAIWTTDSSSTVNQNHYAAKSDVYLNGGPHKDSGNISDGNYYVRVIQPQGQKELGFSKTASISVTGGKFAEVYRLVDLVYETSSPSARGFDNSGNMVYKVQIGQYNITRINRSFDILNAKDREDCWVMDKNDNFTVGGDKHITITKIIDNENSSTQKFHLQLTDESDVSSMYEITVGLPFVISDLVSGEYTLKEVDIPSGYTFKGITADTVNLDEDLTNASVSFVLNGNKNPNIIVTNSKEVEVSPSPPPEASPTPTPSATPTPEASPTPTPSATPTPEASPTPTPSATPTPEASPTPTPSATPPPEVSPTPTPSATPSPEVSPTPTPSATPTPEASPTPVPAPVFTAQVVTEQVTLITAVSGEGSVLPGPGSNSYDKGTTVQLNPSPAPGWQFSGWQGDAVDNNNQINMDTNKRVTAVFTEIQTVIIPVPVEPAAQAPAVTPPAEVPQMTEVTEEVLPAGPAALPKTGGIPAGVLYGIGGLITAAGLLIRKKK